MQTYAKYAPTGFDPSGCFLPDRQDWLVVPVGRNRDSQCLDNSNFDAALKMLGGERKCIEVHRFGHWGCGWFEIIIVHPWLRKRVEEIEQALENYPVLDDEDHSKREWEEFCEAWSRYGYKDFCNDIRMELDVNEELYYRLCCVDHAVLRDLYMETANEPYYFDSGGCNMRCQSAAEKVTIHQVMVMLFKHENPSKSRKGILDWIQEFEKDSGHWVPLPSILMDDYDQQYLWPKQYIRYQRKQLRKLLCG